MRTLFFGTPDIAVPAFDELHQISEIAAVVCQPDRPAGRKLQLRPPPIKQRALELGLEVVQPTKIRTKRFAAWIRSLEADVAVVMAYGRILPPAVLEGPRLGFVNLHASLLPKYRGAAPINWAIAHGEKETGICLMQMDQGCDTGPVYTRRSIPIGPNTTAGALANDLATLAATVVGEDLGKLVDGELPAEAQDDAAATMAPLLKKTDGQVDWTLDARQVHDRVRGMTPWPGAHSWLGPKRVKLLETALGEPSGNHGPAGSVLTIRRDDAEIACGTGTIFLARAQLEGKKVLSAAQLAAGRSLAVGMTFADLEPADDAT